MSEDRCSEKKLAGGEKTLKEGSPCLSDRMLAIWMGRVLDEAQKAAEGCDTSPTTADATPVCAPSALGVYCCKLPEGEVESLKRIIKKYVEDLHKRSNFLDCSGVEELLRQQTGLYKSDVLVSAGYI